MTIREAIALADEQKPNQVSKALKLRWLSELDGRVVCEIISPRGEEGFLGYGASVPESTVLKVPHPYDAIYPAWIAMNVARMNGESAKCNDYADVCEEHLDGFRRFWARANPPSTCKLKYF